MFSKEFRKTGTIGLAKYLHIYKRGDIVDIKGDILPKRINIRVEHIKHSKSRLSFIERVHKNEETRKANKAAGINTPLKRIPAQPLTAHVVKGSKGVETVAPIKYEFII